LTVEISITDMFNLCLTQTCHVCRDNLKTETHELLGLMLSLRTVPCLFMVSFELNGSIHNTHLYVVLC